MFETSTGTWTMILKWKSLNRNLSLDYTDYKSPETWWDVSFLNISPLEFFCVQNKHGPSQRIPFLEVEIGMSSILSENPRKDVFLHGFTNSWLAVVSLHAFFVGDFEIPQKNKSSTHKGPKPNNQFCTGSSFVISWLVFSKHKNTQNSQRTTNSNLVALTMKFHACRLAQKASDACGMSYVAVGFCLKISVFPCVSFMKQRQGNLLHLGRSEHSLQHLLGVKAMICEPNLIGSNSDPRV